MGIPPASHGTFLPNFTALLDFPLPPHSSVSFLPLSFSFFPSHLSVLSAFPTKTG